MLSELGLDRRAVWFHAQDVDRLQHVLDRGRAHADAGRDERSQEALADPAVERERVGEPS